MSLADRFEQKADDLARVLGRTGSITLTATDARRIAYLLRRDDYDRDRLAMDTRRMQHFSAREYPEPCIEMRRWQRGIRQRLPMIELRALEAAYLSKRGLR